MLLCDSLTLGHYIQMPTFRRVSTRRGQLRFGRRAVRRRPADALDRCRPDLSPPTASSRVVRLPVVRCRRHRMTHPPRRTPGTRHVKKHTDDESSCRCATPPEIAGSPGGSATSPATGLAGASRHRAWREAVGTPPHSAGGGREASPEFESGRQATTRTRSPA